MENFAMELLVQLAYQSPTLLAYVIGLVLALVFLRRCPGPAVLTLIATVMMLLTAIGYLFLQRYLAHARLDAGWSVERYAQMMTVIGIISNVIRAVAFGLLLAAIFVGRAGRPAATDRVENRFVA